MWSRMEWASSRRPFTTLVGGESVRGAKSNVGVVANVKDIFSNANRFARRSREMGAKLKRLADGDYFFTIVPAGAACSSSSGSIAFGVTSSSWPTVNFTLPSGESIACVLPASASSSPAWTGGCDALLSSSPVTHIDSSGTCDATVRYELPLIEMTPVEAGFAVAGCILALGLLLVLVCIKKKEEEDGEWTERTERTGYTKASEDETRGDDEGLEMTQGRAL